MSLLKSPTEIQTLKQGGEILANILQQVIEKCTPGITTGELNQFAEEMIYTAGGEPSFKGYGDPPYPSGLCTSINNELVHGIPGEVILKDGDILSLDIGMRYPKSSGLYTDMAVTVPIGKIDAQTEKLIRVTKRALEIWTSNLKAGDNLYAVAKLVQEYIEREGFSVVREMVGHGVGHAVHEDPPIPNYYIRNTEFILKEGMVLALEPMVSSGDFRIKVLDDQWTISSIDNSLTAHFEHTVVITKRGCDIITK
ncbi:type I methionyl aminopeptidase [Candidatus Falkowbacteria bacterium]|jgi:methionyl aminopeptidase|nr:type I methionyl aminopeptidase [Candidatus Falkowbacteria bacterium]MBT5503008.1 type I methionyl aminopeptidase [Candidatus Falkowbacteria bacterium]MBT6574364.1 type I methionyl aminopeptidase [Candidatus Falkowbacteria bacterium]MBT7349043.1 type I methionyl aminopeptidase [Candidatus Falkowbacteria bacterium]MBT7500963.1 type I methionyl aminopeptidase [Candidatus Falkowbacteria bacterium]